MPLFGTGSISTPARVVLDAFLVIAGLLIAAEVFRAGADRQDGQALTV